MLIQAKTEIKGIHLEMSVADAKEILKNPRKIQTEIRVMLRHYEVELGREHQDRCTPDKAKTSVDKPFVCACGRRYAYEGYLERHQRVCDQAEDEVD